MVTRACVRKRVRVRVREKLPNSDEMRERLRVSFQFISAQNDGINGTCLREKS